MKKLLFLSICFLQTSLFMFAQNTRSCDENLSEVVSSMKLIEGENPVCTADDGLQYIAIVKSGKVIDWKIKDARGNKIAYKIVDSKVPASSNNDGKRAAKGKSSSTSTTINIPVEIIICTIVNGKVTKNCRTVIKT